MARSLEPSPRSFQPPASDRQAWDAEPLNRKAIIEQAQTELTEKLPGLSEKMYLDYFQSGDRARYEAAFGKRLTRAARLALAECVEYQGRFLPALRETLQAIADEETWVLPAHSRNKQYADTNPPGVDLAAAMRAGALATISQWLGSEIGKDLDGRVREEIFRRVISPYLQRVYEGPPALNQADALWWITNKYNWNAVCHAGVAYACLATVNDPIIRAKVAAAAQLNIGSYLKGFGKDGYCNEGVAYWDYGVGSFVALAETLLRATGGQVNIYDDERLPAIASYPHKFEIAPLLYPTFADTSPNVRVIPWIVHMLSRRFSFPSDIEEKIAGGRHEYGIMLYQTDLTLNPPPVAAGTNQVATDTSLSTYFPDAQVMIARPRNPVSGLAVAMKGGKNGLPHGHLDLASYVVASDGVPVLVDPGAEVYTKRTFSSQRFDSKILNSYGHPVPTIDGQLQNQSGAASVITCDRGDDGDVFVLDLSRAYAVPGIRSIKRSLSFSRKGKTSATITDEFEFFSPKRIGTALITFGTFKRLDDRRLLIEADGSAVIAELDTGGVPFQITEETLVEHTTTGRVVRRIGIDLATPVEKATIGIHIEPVSTRDFEAVTLSGGGIEGGDISSITRVKAEEAVGETSPKIEKADRSLAEKNAFYLWGTEGHAAEWHFDVPASDTYALCLRYASGFPGLSRRKVEIDGRSIAPDSEDIAFSFPPTGGWGEKDDHWQTRALAVNGRPLGIQLKKGRHVVRVINVSRAGMNLESLELVALKGIQAN